MSLRTRIWGQIGIQAKQSALADFQKLPALIPPVPVGLRSSEEAWDVPSAGVMIADDLPPSLVPLRPRASVVALNTLQKLLPNTEQRTRWTESAATRNLLDFLGDPAAEKPVLWDDWRSDTGWARAFVQGPCAGDLKREGEQWVADASVLALGELRPGMAPMGVKVALNIDNDGLRPAWVQMQDGTRVTPLSDNWPYVRLVAAAGMQNYVGNVRHVLNLHFVAAQGLAVLVHNHLPWHHPITRLLFPHAAGTLSVNWTANKTYMGAGKLNENTYAFTWKGTQQLVPIAFKAFEWADYNIPEVFKRRGTMDLIERGQYPYGEDALLIWNTIDKYVADYLAQYYQEDSDVADDAVLQGAFEALDPAVAKPLRARTVEELRLVITRLIHMVSVEHKLVSGIAFDYFTNPFYFPHLAHVGRHPEDAVPYREEAENNVMFRYAISARAWPLMTDWSYVALDTKGGAAMRRFKDGLAAAGKTIDERNKKRRVPFEHLHPSGLEPSVAV